MKKLPSIIFLAFMLIDIGYVMGLDGQPHKYPYSLAAEIFEFFVMGSLLFFGGFFDELLGIKRK